jgi:hypothetical protein
MARYDRRRKKSNAFLPLTRRAGVSVKGRKSGRRLPSRELGRPSLAGTRGSGGEGRALARVTWADQPGLVFILFPFLLSSFSNSISPSL